MFLLVCLLSIRIRNSDYVNFLFFSVNGVLNLNGLVYSPRAFSLKSFIECYLEAMSYSISGESVHSYSANKAKLTK